MKNKLFKITGFKLGVLITILITALYFYNTDFLKLDFSNIDFLKLIELKALDFRFKLRGKIEPNSPVVIVGIDDKSVKKIGRWPWPRSYIADLIDFMTEADAKVVGFDITFSEPDKNSELLLVNDIISQSEKWDIKDENFENYIQDKKKLADNDQRLEEAIKKNGRVILGYFFHTEETKKRLDEETKNEMTQNYELIADSKLAGGVHYSSEQAQEFKFIELNAADVNIKKISDVSSGSGYFNVFNDIDGTVRWLPLVIKYQNGLFPPLSLQILREYLRKKGEDFETIKVKVNELGIYEIKLDEYTISTDSFGRMMINFKGGEYTFKYHSFVDVINGDVPKEEFKDKMVLVGANSIGIYDMRVTPFSSVYPGVETHANIIDNILNQNPLISPVWVKLADILTIFLLGIAIAYIIPKHKASNSALAVLILLAGYVALNHAIFVYKYTWLNIVYPVFTILTSSLILYTYRFAIEEREKRWLRGAFSHYVTESVVSDMVKNPEKLKLGGDKKDLTVLFSDIRGFTTISEGLKPAELVHLLNEYLTEMTKVVFKYEGTLDKYMGDAIMAIYGAPQDMPGHPFKACMTALDMMRQLNKMQIQWEKKSMPKIDIGIGINTGAMSVGNMGSDVRFDYTVMGDNVNLGSRLEGTNKQYGTNIIISEFTHELVKDRLICRQLDVVRVKGKKLPVKIYQLIGNKRMGDRRAAETIETKKKYDIQRSGKDRRKKDTNDFERLSEDFEMALKKYFERQFEESLRLFETLEKDYPDDKPIKLFINRTRDFIDNPPPPDWDGVYTMKTK